MNTFKLSISTLLLSSTLLSASGDTSPIEPQINIPETVGNVSDSNVYLGLAYAYVSETSDPEETGNAFTLIGGYNINSYLSIEARYTKTIGDMDVEGLGDLGREVSNQAIYIKPQYNIVDSVNVYALLGYGELVARDTSGQGFQWGAGLSYDINDNVSLFVDYTNLYDDTLDDVGGIYNNNLDAEATAVNIGLTYHF
jgi:opacity protein-like surface antigen